MALGAITAVKKGVLAPGGLRFAIIEVVPTTGANYTANGETFSLATIASATGFRKEVIAIWPTPKNEASGASYLLWDKTNNKLVAMDSATGVEEAGSQDLSAQTHVLFCVGR